MSSGYVIPVDPTELASRFASHDPYLDDEEEGSEDDAVSLEEAAELFRRSDYESKIVPLLDRIPPKEADLLTLYYLYGKKQAELAAMFAITQAAVSYRLARAVYRLKYLVSIPPLTEDQLRETLPELFPDPMTVEILVGMFNTTCQSEVAKLLGESQGLVRHGYLSALETLKIAAEQNEKYVPYFQLFHKISGNFNAIREVVLPQWSGRGGNTCE